MLTKKDFKAVAEIIRKRADYHRPIAGRNTAYHTINLVGQELADYFATQNPRFDRSRFMQACGLT